MPEEASQQVTYDDLDRAAAEAMGQEAETEAVTETQEEEEQAIETAESDTDTDVEESDEETEEIEASAEEEPKKERDTENAIRSWVGRQLKERDDALLEKIETLLKTNQPQAVESEPEEEEFITTKTLPSFIDRQIKERTEREAAEKNKYQKDFTRAFANEGASAENFDAIWNEFLENHNEVVTGDAVADAKIGFYKAQAALVGKAKPKNPVQGKGKVVKTKTNIPDQMAEKTPKPVKLDPVAAEYVRKMKLNDEFVQKTLNK